jgi:hypothetical protein
MSMKWVHKHAPAAWQGWLLMVTDGDNAGFYLATYKFRMKNEPSGLFHEPTTAIWNGVGSDSRWTTIDVPEGLTDEEAMAYLTTLVRLA